MRCEAKGTTLGLESLCSFEGFVETVYDGSKEGEGKKWVCPPRFVHFPPAQLLFTAKSSSTGSFTTVEETQGRVL